MSAIYISRTVSRTGTAPQRLNTCENGDNFASVERKRRRSVHGMYYLTRNLRAVYSSGATASRCSPLGCGHLLPGSSPNVRPPRECCNMKRSGEMRTKQVSRTDKRKQLRRMVQLGKDPCTLPLLHILAEGGAIVAQLNRVLHDAAKLWSGNLFGYLRDLSACRSHRA